MRSSASARTSSARRAVSLRGRAARCGRRAAGWAARWASRGRVLRRFLPYDRKPCGCRIAESLRLAASKRTGERPVAHPRDARRRAPGARRGALRAALAARAGALLRGLVAAGRLPRARARPRRVDPHPAGPQGRRRRAVAGSSSSRRSASPTAIRTSGSSPPPTWGWSRAGSTRSCRRTPPGTPSTTSRPQMAFDHGPIVLAGRERLRAKLSYTNIGFALAPESFTMSELSSIYTAALGYAGRPHQPAPRARAPRPPRGHRRAPLARARRRAPRGGLPLRLARARGDRPVRRAAAAYVGSSSRLTSSAGAECVSAPTLM